jgi:hypothetical protein
MPWLSKTVGSLVALAAIPALISCGSSADEREAAVQFEILEEALVSLAESPEDQWMDRLDRLEKLPLTSAAVIEVRDLCGSAYSAFGEATSRLEEARHRVAGVEILAEQGQGDAGVKRITEMRAKAVRSTAQVSQALDRAEELVSMCVASRRNLREKIAAGAAVE